MTTPHTPPAQQVDHLARLWRDLTRDAQNRPIERASVAAATHLANRIWRPDDPKSRETFEGLAPDDAWHTMALTAYEMLRSTGAYTHLAAASAYTCKADLEAIEAWLTSPSALPGLADMTTAATWGVGDDFDNQDSDAAQVMATLLTQAQKAGLFGVPGHDIKLRTVTGEDDIEEFLIQLDTPHGATFAYGDLAADHLIDDDQVGVQAAVSLLANTAIYVDLLLGQQARIAAAAGSDTLPALDQIQAEPTPESATQQGRNARAFAPLALDPASPPPTSDSPTTPQPPTSPTRRR